MEDAEETRMRAGEPGLKWDLLSTLALVTLEGRAGVLSLFLTFLWSRKTQWRALIHSLEAGQEAAVTDQDPELEGVALWPRS